MFDEIIQKLKKYPGARYEVAEDRIRVLPVTQDGFEGTIEQIWEDHFTVSFDGWHEEFFDYRKASDWFLMVLSDRCRLRRMAEAVFHATVPPSILEALGYLFPSKCFAAQQQLGSDRGG